MDETRAKKKGSDTDLMSWGTTPRSSLEPHEASMSFQKQHTDKRDAGQWS